MSQIIKTVYINDIIEINVDERCHRAFPCQHDAQVVTKDNDIIHVKLSGLTIYKILIKLGRPVSDHFLAYKDCLGEISREFSSFL